MKLKRLINEKPPNPGGTAEENRKIVGALNFLAPRGALKKSSAVGEKPLNLVGTLERKTERYNCS